MYVECVLECIIILPWQHPPIYLPPLLIAPTNTPVAVAVVCIDESSTDGFVFPLM